jgi:hypothetical protein
MGFRANSTRAVMDSNSARLELDTRGAKVVKGGKHATAVISEHEQA